MRKKELLSIKQLNVPAKVRGNERYGRYVKAVVENGTLKVAVWEDAIEVVDIYINKTEEKWLTYIVPTGKWSSARYENLCVRVAGHRLYLQYIKKATWESTADKAKVNEYLETGANMSILAAVRQYQKEVAIKRLVSSKFSEMQAIDDVMEQVPELPKRFKKWAQRGAFADNQYILYKTEKSRVEGYCTWCEKWSELKPKPKHNQMIQCPSCKMMVQAKSYGKQRAITDRRYIAIIQRLKDDTGYIIRKMQTYQKFEKETGYKREQPGLVENFRYRVTNDFYVMDVLEFGEYKLTGEQRWLHNINHGMNYTCIEERDSTLAAYYTGNLSTLLRNTKLHYMPVKKILDAGGSKTIRLDRKLRCLLKTPECETLAKIGMEKLAYEIADDRFYSRTIWKNRYAKKLWAKFGISKESFQILRRTKGDYQQLRILQMAADAGVRINEQELIWLDRYVGKSLIIEKFRYSTPHKMIRYLIKQGAELNGPYCYSNVVRDYYDYIEELEKLELPMTRDTLFPQNLMQQHEVTSQKIREKNDMYEKASLEKKNKMLEELTEEREKLFTLHTDEYMVVFPKRKEDFDEEGRQQHNCVGQYFDRVVKKSNVVFFLRKKEDPKKSYCTVEVSKDYMRVIQCRLKYNEDAPKEVSDWVEKLMKEVRKNQLAADRRESNKMKIAG